MNPSPLCLLEDGTFIDFLNEDQTLELYILKKKLYILNFTIDFFNPFIQIINQTKYKKIIFSILRVESKHFLYFNGKLMRFNHQLNLHNKLNQLMIKQDKIEKQLNDNINLYQVKDILTNGYKFFQIIEKRKKYVKICQINVIKGKPIPNEFIGKPFIKPITHKGIRFKYHYLTIYENV